MADNKINDAHATDRGLFDFMKKNDDSEAEVASTGVHNLHVSEPEKHNGLLHRSHSSSDEEGDEEEKKKRRKEKKEKKASLKEKIEDKVGDEGDTNVPIENVNSHPSYQVEGDMENKGLLDKIPGFNSKTDAHQEINKDHD